MAAHLRIGILIFFCVANSLNVISSSKNITSFGCIPNTGKDASKQFQKAIDFVYENDMDSLIIPKGIYVLNSIDIPPGIVIIGKNRPTLKKVANAGKWSRMFNTQTGKYAYENERDSKPLVIENVHFDGNYQNQGAYQKYELQQQHLIMICAKPQSKGRFVATISNCTFKNSVADGISVYTNADVNISKCSAENIFRGGIVLGGGNSKLKVENYRGSGKTHPSGFHIEVDGAGYNNSLRIDVAINHLVMEDGHFDIIMSEGKVVGEDILCKKPLVNFNTNGVGEINIRKSIFYCGNNSNSMIFFPKKVSFDDCTFYSIDTAKGSCCFYVLNNSNYKIGNQHRLSFNNCTFESKSIINNTSALIISPDKKELNNTVSAKGCKFINFKTGIQMKQGGTLQIENTEFRCINTLDIAYTEHYLYDLTLKKINLTKGSSNKFLLTENARNTINLDKNYFVPKNK